MSATNLGERVSVACDQEGCKAFATQANAATLGWDWFTGVLPATRHFCAKHAWSEQRNEEFANSRKELPSGR